MQFGFRVILFTFFVVFLEQYVECQIKRDQSQQIVERVDDLKKFKALLRTKNNVLVLYSKTGENVPAVRRLLPMFAEVGEKMYGKATVAFVNCGTEEGKKLCKKMKITPDPTVIKHYNNGDFNRDYNRRETLDTFVRFLNDPTGEVPWEDEEIGKDIVHVQDAQAWSKLLRKEKLPILGMFYAPWCNFCKRMKPDYSAAAGELKSVAILAGIDVTRTENYQLQDLYNITGFPTLLYFQNGRMKFPYPGGANTKDEIVQWMKNPQPTKAQTPEEPADDMWADDEKSVVVHLTDQTFDTFVAVTPSVLVMFYAPWCGHCKRMKPNLVQAATILKEEGIAGVIAAVDATKEKNVAEKHDVKGYPTVKYFKDGIFAWEFNERATEKLVEFMKDPKEPPPPPPPEQPWHLEESDVVHLTVDSFKTELKKRKHVIVMFYAPWCGHCKMAKPEYTKAAARYKDDAKVMFGALDCTTHMAVCQQHGVTGYPMFKYFSYLKMELPFEGARNEIDFVTFMSNQIDPSAPASPPSITPPSPASNPWDTSVQLLTPDTFESTLGQYKRAMIMFFAPWCGHCKKAKPEFTDAAKSAKQGIGYSMMDCSTHAEFCQKKGIQGYPTFHIYVSGQFERVYEGPRSKDSFVDALEMESKESSQPSPAPATEKVEEQWDDSVSLLTSETFQPTISKAERALVMFYAPWCGHCQKAKPDFISAAKHFTGNESDRLFAAIDCAQYTDFCREKGITGFPTIQLYDKGVFAKAYSGNRSKDSFITFVDEPIAKAEPAAPTKKQEL